MAVPSPAAAQDFATACPEITDSVYRLYAAYFLRQPDQGGFDYWLDVYSSGSNLDGISNSFAVQPEFVQTYGTLDDAQFVDLVYNNVLGRAPDGGGRAHWISALGGGFSRGELMISFSESAEFVGRTQTTEPMAGLGMWYPEGTRWACGQGNWDWATDLTGQNYMDVLFINTGDSAGEFTVDALDQGGATKQRMLSEQLSAGFYHMYWNMTVSDLVPVGALRAAAPENGYITMVAFNHPHSAERPGWGD